MINHSVKVSLKSESKGSLNIIYSSDNSLGLGYPCGSSELYKCTPYIINLKRGIYLFECWGSKGSIGQNNSRPGFGAYTSGIITLREKATFYIYVGYIGLFNAAPIEDLGRYGVKPGGATDVRIDTADEWYDKKSLISRIMVAAGGGGAEWASIGGNGGGIKGGESFCSKSFDEDYFEKPCKGGNQTSGSLCENHSIYLNEANPNMEANAASGSFGVAGSPPPTNDYGGIGGGGYYGGTSYTYSCAGSGGSSFISGHEGCDAVENKSDKIIHTGKPNHYSGYVFRESKMINGNETMPLPSNNLYGYHQDTGAFRITILSEYMCYTYIHRCTHNFLQSSLFVFLS